MPIVLFLLLLIFNTAHCDESLNSSFSMLQSNQIVGMIPDIDDAYGVGFRDLNNDRHPDIYIVCFRNLNRLLINNGGLIPFVDRTMFSGTGGYLMPSGNANLELGISIADYDNDGLADMYLAGWGKTHRLFRNQGNVVFNDATNNLNAQGKMDSNQGLWIDADNDGFLDLYITDEHRSNRLLINQQNGSFKEDFWTNTFIDNAVSQGASNSDIDMDGDQDIYVSNWFEPDYLLINNGNRLFTKLDIDLPTLKDSISTNSSTFSDFDNDGDTDLIVCGNNGFVFYYENQSDSAGILFINRTNHPFHFLDTRVFGVLAEDFNLDGWLDVFITTRGENRLYLNDQTGNFFYNYDTDQKEIYSTGASAADFDNDGDLDIIVSNKNDFSQVYLNPSNSQKFLKLKFRGVKSNRDAVGTKVFFYSPSDSGKDLIAYREVAIHTSYLSSKAPDIVFGMGNLESVDIKVIFPSGEEVNRENRLAGKTYTIREFRGPIASYYSTLHTLKFLTARTDFWINVLLVLVIILAITGYLFLGLRRYYWSAFNISLQLSLWFVASLFLFLVFRTSSTLTLLLSILSLALFSFILLILYSEHFLRLRRKRDSIRSLLQALSDRIINIHDNQQLAEEVVTTILKHPEVKDVLFFTNNKNNSLEYTFGSNGHSQNQIEIDKEDLFKLLSSAKVSSEDLDFNKKINLCSNLFLPVKRKENLLGLIALNMPNISKLINQEDIERLTSIASQTAIAIENNNYIQESADLIEQLTSAKVREQYISKLENTNAELDSKNKELKRLFSELQEKEAQLIHSEKMASLGHLVAGISHELNNPISFIYSNMSILNEYIDDLKKQLSAVGEDSLKTNIQNILDELSSIIEDSTNGSKAIKEIVQDLKNFSRLDQAEWKESKISEIINSCLKILSPQIPETIKVKKDFIDDPAFFCNPGQLNQVFLNLLTNAYQAIEKEGLIQIYTEIKKDSLIVKIKDNGTGIPKNIQKKIFDPFFTTKPVNKGTGLGLSISYSIIEKHNGLFNFESKTGVGTTFIIELPLSLERQLNDA